MKSKMTRPRNKEESMCDISTTDAKINIAVIIVSLVQRPCIKLVKEIAMLHWISD